eukprot:CAMPEP_0198588848 /NCGR_PEP_ID=MMETSP1462-20131121/133630_1 /TAXON_ID=1333877 /ORGANISM="Brandtodinium nutriculum, Strain RCC3387" /LENGTH=98 /DNA_ID=CAMNT_0044320353 /DNA_START=259 /DNA_END=553 /DNA_ORIENTATION=+
MTKQCLAFVAVQVVKERVLQPNRDVLRHLDRHGPVAAIAQIERRRQVTAHDAAGLAGHRHVALHAPCVHVQRAEDVEVRARAAAEVDDALRRLLDEES